MSRKGAGIELGSISLHPSGFTHGPQPGSVEASIGKEATDELAVMVDTFRPLDLCGPALECEDTSYAWTWSQRELRHDAGAGVDRLTRRRPKPASDSVLNRVARRLVMRSTPHERKRLMAHRTHVRRTAVLSVGAALVMAGALLPAASAIATPAAPSAADPLRYRIGEVITGGTLGTVSAMAMNEASEVVGATNYPLDAFRWSGGEFETLPDLPGHEEHIAHDLTDNGTVVGIAGRFGEDNYPRAVRWVDGVPEDLGVLEPTGASEAYGVNDAGMVVGSASVGFGWRGFVWTEDAGMVDITGEASAGRTTSTSPAR